MLYHHIAQEVLDTKTLHMETSSFATDDHKNTEEISSITRLAAENETLEGKTVSSSSSRDNCIMIPEICVQQHESETENRRNYLAVDMCSSATGLKIPTCNTVTRRISEAGVVNIPDKDKLKPAERLTRRRKRSLSLDPQILLQWAATHNDIDTLKGLLESTNVDLNVPGVDGFYPLHRAASTGSLECLQYLVTKGAQIEVRDKDGSSPLDAAVSEGEFDCARFLIEKGASINHIRDGFTDKDLVHRRKLRGMTIL